MNWCVLAFGWGNRCRGIRRLDGLFDKIERDNALVVDFRELHGDAALVEPQLVFGIAIHAKIFDGYGLFADLHLTRQLREAAKAVDIDLIDHVIIGRASADPLGRGFYSFRESGVL